MINIGEIYIFREKVDNPYKIVYETLANKSDICLMFKERFEAFKLIEKNQLPEEYDIWHLPKNDIAHRITRDEIYG